MSCCIPKIISFSTTSILANSVNTITEEEAANVPIPTPTPPPKSNAPPTRTAIPPAIPNPPAAIAPPPSAAIPALNAAAPASPGAAKNAAMGLMKSNAIATATSIPIPPASNTFFQKPDKERNAS
ncbi:hypothetical protein D7Y07_10120 [Bacteroides acidifaciens]|uniref:Uncharacterized protein n=1 Tax=Bacteroides acidifaciens TaxID=85831 RepID=A0A3L8A7D6_9BACE|nr:hypothetical protein D7Y07_10120 [Bacteroides acidifaciens]